MKNTTYCKPDTIWARLGVKCKEQSWCFVVVVLSRGKTWLCVWF